MPALLWDGRPGGGGATLQFQASNSNGYSSAGPRDWLIKTPPLDASVSTWSIALEQQAGRRALALVVVGAQWKPLLRWWAVGAVFRPADGARSDRCRLAAGPATVRVGSAVRTGPQRAAAACRSEPTGPLSELAASMVQASRPRSVGPPEARVLEGGF